MLAFMLAPLAGPLGIAMSVAVPFMISNPNPFELIGLILLIYVFATPVVYFFSIVLGLPFYLLLRSTLGLSEPGLIIGWAGIGMASAFCFFGFDLPDRLGEILLYLPFALGGAAVGFVFWHILCANDELKQRQAVIEERHEMAQISREQW
jgi:hypothetical protein